MKIQYASDLHLEFRENTEYLSQHPLTVKGDILVLAGDILVFRGKSWERHPFFDWCAKNYKETFIIPGNHEYYDGVELSTRFDDYEYYLRDNVRYINNRSVIFNEVELFFTTLWTKVSPAEIVPVQMGLTDCRKIIYNGAGFTSQDYAALHQICLDWLTDALANSKAKNKVVVTHHQPTTCIRDPQFKLSLINSAFAVPMDNFIESSGADYWIYGHTHYNTKAQTVIGKTILLCNQLGYVKHGEHLSFSNDSYILI